MTDKTEAQPEALRLSSALAQADRAEAAAINYGEGTTLGIEACASAKTIRALHAEMQQLKAQKAHLRDALTDIASGEITRSHCVGPHCTEELSVATADELSSRAAGALNWDDLVAQQFPDVGIPISAQLSARQAAPDGQWKCGNEYLPYHPGASHVDPAYRDGWNDCYRAAPPPPEREPLLPDFPGAKLHSPTCWCETCDTTANSGLRSRMSLCPDCGNKRCPKANHHNNACTNSNAPGQPGSSWEHVKPHGATNDNP